MTTKPSRSTQPTQFLFDWSATAAPPPALTDAIAPAEPPAPSSDAVTEKSDAQSKDLWSDAIAFRNPDLLQVLPWDFRTSFPEPLDEAIEAGKLHEDDVLFENLKALHDEHARHALALLSDLDAVMDARRAGVDPRTGVKPRTSKQKEALQKLFGEEPKRLEHAFDPVMLASKCSANFRPRLFRSRTRLPKASLVARRTVPS
jgi:hypothetical protein